MKVVKRIVPFLFAAVVVALLMEGTAQVFCLFSPRLSLILSRSWVNAAIPDAVLQARPNPAHPDHDRNGFRNREVPAHPGIVCIGDSQTYGAGVTVSRENAWPQQLARLAGITTYNMSFGGYGPAHSLVLMDQALAMKPGTIIEALYSGNDLYDVFNMVYLRGQLEYLKTADPRTLAAIAELERTKPLATAIEDQASMGKAVQRRGFSVKAAVMKLVGFVEDHSKLYGVARALGRLTVDNRILGALAGFIRSPFASRDPEYCLTFDDGTARTLFSIKGRLLALDLNDIRIRESHRIALECIVRMNDKADKNGTGFTAVLIPTKELVYSELVLRHWKTLPASYATLIRNEELFFSLTKEELTKRGIPWVDTLPALRECLSLGRNPYPVTRDGHPNAVGYGAIARAVQAGLQEQRNGKAASHEQTASVRY